MPPKRGKKESKRTLYHILGNLDEFVPPATCQASLEELLDDGSDEDNAVSPLSGSCSPTGLGGRSLSPLSPAAYTADPLAVGKGRGKRLREEDTFSPHSPNATIVIGGSTAGRRKGEAATDDSPMFLSELGMRERVAQRNTESTLYFAESAGHTTEVAPLKELVDWIDGIGAAKHLQEVRHMGQLHQLLSSFLGKPFSSRAGKRLPSNDTAKCHALLLLYICHQAPSEIVAVQELFNYLVDMLTCCDNSQESESQSTNGETPSPFPPPPQLPPKKQSHWSTLLSKTKNAPSSDAAASLSVSPERPKSKASKGVSTAKVVTTHQQVWTTIRGWLVATSPNSAENIPAAISEASLLEVVIDTLLHVVLDSNRRILASAEDPSTRLFGEGSEEEEDTANLDSQLSGSQLIRANSFSSQGSVTKPGGILLATAGGYEGLARVVHSLHKGSGDEAVRRLLSKAAQLLEAATCCEELRRLPVYCEPLQILFVTLFRMLPTGISAQLEHESFIQRIRVCLNISSVSPKSVPTDETRCAEMADVLTSLFAALSTPDGDAEDRQTQLELCSSVVCLVVNCLDRGNNTTFRWALINSLDKRFAQVAAEVAQRFYAQEEDISMSVTAGYLAVMLGMMSLQDPDARIVIVTALLNGAPNSVQSVRHKPMLWVIAVLQEFIMFQSTAQILTKNTVVTLTYVVDTLMEENGITVGEGSIAQ